MKQAVCVADTICPRPARYTPHAVAHLQSIAYTPYACGTQRALLPTAVGAMNINELMNINPQPVTWGPFGPHSGLMAVYFRSPSSSTMPFKVVVRPPNVYEEVCFFFLSRVS